MIKSSGKGLRELRKFSDGQMPLTPWSGSCPGILPAVAEDEPYKVALGLG